MTAYYNEIDPYAAQWLRNLISKNLIAPGDVDERSIVDVHAEDLNGYTQCHFFAGIGGWSLAARLAGWPDERPLWTGSCPCQPFSVAGKGEGKSDARHLWPALFELIRYRQPDVVMGEQVAAAVGKDWLDGVYSDLESIGYSCGAAVVPACAVDAPHRRDRLWFVADATYINDRIRYAGQGERCQPESGGGREQNAVANAASRGCKSVSNAGYESLFGALAGSTEQREQPSSDSSGVLRRNSTAWSDAEWVTGSDGKARRFEPGIRLLAHGVPSRMGKLRAYGNAIVPALAAEVIGAYMDIAA